MLTVSLFMPIVAGRCGTGVELNPAYAPDHANYLCRNYSRPTPLPCVDPADKWEPRWLSGKRRFVVFAWWPPVNADFEAYADAGFNMALTGNALGAYCAQKTKDFGRNATVSQCSTKDATPSLPEGFKPQAFRRDSTPKPSGGIQTPSLPEGFNPQAFRRDAIPKPSGGMQTKSLPGRSWAYAR